MIFCSQKLHLICVSFRILLQNLSIRVAKIPFQFVQIDFGPHMLLTNLLLPGIVNELQNSVVQEP